MSIEDSYLRFFALTGDAAAAAVLVLVERMADEKPAEKPLSVAEVAKLLHVSPEKVRSWCRSGALTATNLGSPKRPRFVVAANEVGEFIKRRQPQRAVNRNCHIAKPVSTIF